MAQYKVDEPDMLIPCPFDKVHMVRASRMPYHIMKCKKNFRGEKFAVCPFNACHYVRQEELQKHIATCKDLARIESDIIFSQQEAEDSKYSGDCSVPDYREPELFEDPNGEDWDAECDTDCGVFKLGQVSADEYFSRRTNMRREVNQSRLPNSIPKVLQAQNNLVTQPIGRGVGRAQTLSVTTPPQLGWNTRTTDNRQNTKVSSLAPRTGYQPENVISVPPSGALVSEYSSPALPLANQQPSHAFASKDVYKESSSQSVLARDSKTTPVSHGRPPPGFGRGSVPVSVNSASRQYATPTVGSGGSKCATSAVDERKKQIRKYRKKLREIEALEDKQKQGRVLDKAQQQKIDSKPDLVERLKSLMIDDQ